MNKILSSLPSPSGSNSLRELFTNYAMVELLGFSRTFDVERYDLEGKFAFDFLTINSAT